MGDLYTDPDHGEGAARWTRWWRLKVHHREATVVEQVVPLVFVVIYRRPGDSGVGPVTYLDAVAEDIRRAVPPAVMPDEDTTDLFLSYAVLLLAKGEGVTREDVHNAWVAWMASRGERPRIDGAVLRAAARDAGRGLTIRHCDPHGRTGSSRRPTRI